MTTADIDFNTLFNAYAASRELPRGSMKKLNSSSIGIYRAMANSFQTFVNHAAVPLQALSESDVREFVSYGIPISRISLQSDLHSQDLPPQVSPTYGYRLLRLIQQVLEFHHYGILKPLLAIVDDVLRNEPYCDANNRDLSPQLDPLSTQEIEVLRKEIDRRIAEATDPSRGQTLAARRRSLRICVAISLQLECGLASGEIRNLKVGDYLGQPWKLDCLSGKRMHQLNVQASAKAFQRIISLPENVAMAINAWINAHPANAKEPADMEATDRSCYLLPGAKATKQWNKRAHILDVDKVLDSIGLQRDSATPRCLRTTFIVHKLRIEGCSVETIRQMLGLKSIKTARRYWACDV